MSNENPEGRTIDRRTLLVAGGAAVATGVLAKVSIADDPNEGEPLAGIMSAEFDGEVGRRQYDLLPLPLDRHVRVNYVGDDKVEDFRLGATVAAVLPRPRRIVAELVGDDKPIEVTRLVPLVLGKASDVQRARG
jgi:hypothetical protein